MDVKVASYLQSYAVVIAIAVTSGRRKCLRHRAFMPISA